jgi:chemotaxis protein histidine kinase CheA
LIILMDGTIDVDTEKGVGTRVAVRLPQKHAAEQA